MQCDFCDNTAAPVTKTYPCADFSDPTGVGRSVGEWMACRVCARLIDGENWELLAVRSCRQHEKDKHYTLLLTYARELHRQFRKYRQ